MSKRKPGKKKSKKSNGPKNQHFVPRCYLSQFTDPQTPEGQEPYVWVFDKNGKNPRKKAPKNIFTQTHLYTFEFSGEKDFSIEKSLSAIESKYAYIFNTKIKHKKPLNETEHAYLCAFVAAQLQRTLRYKENQESFIQQLIDHGTQMALAHGMSDSAQVRQWKEYKKDIHKLQLVEGIPYLANLLMQMSLAFLCVKNTDKHWFITSDDPCVLFNPDLQWQRFYGPGFGQKNIQLTLALSPEITVMFTWANFHGYSYANGNTVDEMLNRMTRSYSNKEFISPRRKTKRIWFSRVPLDLFFLTRILRQKTRFFISDFKRSIKYKKRYVRKR
jgi:predicted SprT family Zn-dependent metalloprotease